MDFNEICYRKSKLNSANSILMRTGLKNIAFMATRSTDRTCHLPQKQRGSESSYDK